MPKAPLREHLATAADTAKSPMRLAREMRLVGAFASGKGDLAENRKCYLPTKLRAKHCR
ncbi:MAG: hypothetical protein HY017_32200 [Betaproteobacteria bacterium]|nr:hypothetical protein [Betaproteobacteria bacterium]